MKTSKDNLLMSTLVATMVMFTMAGAVETLAESDAPANMAAPVGPQAAVRPTTSDVPAVVVTAPRITRIG